MSTNHFGELRGVSAADISDQLNNSLGEFAANFGFDTDGFLVGISLSLCHVYGEQVGEEGILLTLRKLDSARCPARTLEDLNIWLDEHNGVMPIVTFHKTVPTARVLECFKDVSIGLVPTKLRVKKLDVSDSVLVD